MFAARRSDLTFGVSAETSGQGEWGLRCRSMVGMTRSLEAAQRRDSLVKGKISVCRTTDLFVFRAFERHFAGWISRYSLIISNTDDPLMIGRSAANTALKSKSTPILTEARLRATPPPPMDPRLLETLNVPLSGVMVEIFKKKIEVVPMIPGMRNGSFHPDLTRVIEKNRDCGDAELGLAILDGLALSDPIVLDDSIPIADFYDPGS